MGRGIPLHSRLGVCKSVVSSPGGVWGGANDFGAFCVQFHAIHASFSAFNSCLEIGRFLHPFTGYSRSDVPF